MGFLTAVNAVLQVANDMKMGHSIAKLILQDRVTAAQTLEEIVKRFTPQQLDEFECKFLCAAMGMITPAQRLRAMELYAYLKVAETLHYGQWRGFSGSEAQALS